MQIRTLPRQQPRRPIDLGVHSVDHFNLIVSDLRLAQKFFSDFGLDVREEGNNLGLYTAGHDAFYVWGPNPPAVFIVNDETAV
jgi:hypothetical protein